MEPLVAGNPLHVASNPWSRLWNSGVLHSCATGIRGNYDGAILAFWHRQFDALQDLSRAVDIGTGNGALLLLARDRARQRGITLELHGIDIADIDPPKNVPDGAQRFEGIAFHPRTSASDLPFEDGTIDLTCSQFGFEYAPRGPAIREMMRVAQTRNRIALVLHSDDSIVAQVAVAQHEGHAFLKHGCAVIDRARDMVPILAWGAAVARGENAGSVAGAEAKRLAFNLSAQALMDAIERLPQAQVLRNAAMGIRAAFEQAGDAPEQADSILRRLQDDLLDEEARLTHLQSALLTAADLDALADTLRQQDYTVRCTALHQREGVKIGWTLEAVRG